LTFTLKPDRLFQVMRDKTKEAVETIDQTRMDMASVTAMIEWITVLTDRNGEGDIDEIKKITQDLTLRLVAMRRKLNKPRFDNSYSPFGFEVGS
jgi:hypothetical protein